jgi:hypothetical protein
VRASRALAAEADDTPAGGPEARSAARQRSAGIRTRLLELAATRAQLATIEQMIAACERQLAAFGMAPDASSENLNPPAEDLAEWRSASCARARRGSHGPEQR